MRREKTISVNPENKENANIQNVKRSFITLEKDKNTRPLKTIQPKEIQTEKPKPQKLNYINRESDYLMPHYGCDVYNNMKTYEEYNIPADFFQRHYRITDTRTKMIDWMIEVLSVFKSDDNTLFLAVNIMDTYLSKTTSMVKQEDIHMLGITCMFLASKFEDVIPLRMDIVVSKIGHNQFSAYLSLI